MSYRALVYATNGPPAKVLRLATLPALPLPARGTVNVKFLMSPVNPADVNVVQGVYPVKAQTQTGENEWIGGNEGVAEVVNVGDESSDLQPGDWVIPCVPQLGTWRARANLDSSSLVKIPRSWGLRRAASAIVNPPTALRLLLDYLPADAPKWVLQNCANSGVGECVVHASRHLGIKSCNFVRDKSKTVDVDGWGKGTVQERLKDLGADEVWDYNELDIKGGDVARMIKARNIKLMLNALSGPYATSMAKLLGAPSAQLVSYGAMSLQPLSFPTSLFIFKDLVSRGFWMNNWYQMHSHQDREEMLRHVGQVFEGMRGVSGREVQVTEGVIEQVFGETNTGKVFLRFV